MKLPLSFRPVLLIVILTWTAVAWGQKTDAPQYAQVVEKLKSGDTTIDFGQLRMAYAASPSYEFDTDSEARKSMSTALQQGDFEKAISTAQKALALDYVDIDAHAALDRAYEASGDHNQASLHHAIVDGLIRSILASGDGTSYNSAYKVIAIREEYIVLEARGLRAMQQSLAFQGTHGFDVFKTKDDHEQPQDVYFNIDIPGAAEARAFGGKKNRKK